MNCLVTGAAGYIGSSLIQRLVQENHQVIGLIHQTPPRFHDTNITYHSVDITTPKSIKDVVKNIDVVFHCAGLVTDYAQKNNYYHINVTGTKNLVEICKKYDCNRFIFLSHIPYEDSKYKYPYPQSKFLAECYLQEQCKKNKFPSVIIRPGNVYGPRAAWVVRPLHAIKHGNITLINKGKGIFHHTYIDNLLDALIQTLTASEIIGKIIEITDGDDSITWKTYLNDLSNMIDCPPIKRNLSKPIAKMIGSAMMIRYRLFDVPPLITPYAVEVFSNTQHVSIEKAKHLLEYHPNINYHQGMMRIKQWIKKNQNK